MAFQARILNEEWARRETLERLQEEQKSMLDHERKKREEFERQQNEKETQLRGTTTTGGFIRHETWVGRTSSGSLLPTRPRKLCLGLS